MAKQRRRDAAIISGAPEGEELLEALARMATEDPEAISIVRRLIRVLEDARKGARLPR